MLDEIKELVNDVKEKKIDLDTALQNESLKIIAQKLKDWKESMKSNRTARLWIQYMDMVEILRTFIRSVRIGDFDLYIQALCLIHPYRAAAGHNNYTKSLALFIPKMIHLKDTHPEVYSSFKNGLFPVRRSDGDWAGIFTDLFIEQVLMAGIKSSGGLTHGRGFDESTRLLFLLSRPICSEVTESIFNIAGCSSSHPDGHRDLLRAHITRDNGDIKKLIGVMNDRGPFTNTTENLISLSSGLMAEDAVNADNARIVGEKILNNMVGHTVADYTFSQKHKVKNLASFTHIKTSSGDIIELEPQILYQRLLITGVCDTPITELFTYELCSIPPSLFDNFMRMRTGDKAELMHYLLKAVPACVVTHELDPADVRFIHDGGRLLHKFAWPKHSTYKQICDMYISHILNTYGQNSLVWFDGYRNATTKDETHGRRQGSEIGATVEVTRDRDLTMSKKAFLANPSNKQALIDLLSEDMQKAGIMTEHADGDADYKIAVTACISALTQPTAAVADDTDILQQLVYQADPTSYKLYMFSSNRKICIKTLQAGLDPRLVESLAFLHSISGCDTTSRPYGIGKGTVLSKYADLHEFSHVFASPSSSQEQIKQGGEKALLIVYGSSADDLNAARVEKFQVKVATSSGIVPPEKLPPTSDAASQHSLRVYHQVQAWRGNDLPPQNMGWNKTSTGFKPIAMTKSAAPEALLRIIRCNCSGKCDTKRCTCRKNGLRCTSACGQCKGLTCENDIQS